MTRGSVSVYRGIRFARAQRFRPPERVPPCPVTQGSGFGAPAPQDPDPLDYAGRRPASPGHGVYPRRRVHHRFGALGVVRRLPARRTR